MSDMFGAPIGISAAEQDMRQGALGGLQAQKLLGEIERQPADKALTEAHARYYDAEADVKQAGLADQKALTLIAANIQAKRAQGETITTDDLRVPKTPEDYLQAFAEASIGKVSPDVTLKLFEKAATVQQHYASAAASRALEVERGLKAHQDRVERIGALATMALQGPQQYAQAKLLAAQENLPIGKLPQSLDAARPLLQGLVTSSMAVKDSLHLKIQQAAEARLSANSTKDAAKKDAQIAVLEQRERAIRLNADLVEKFGGENTKATINAKNAAAAAKTAVADLRTAKQFIPLPLDGTQLSRTQGYKIGKDFYYWIGQDADGKDRFEPAATVHKGRMNAAAKDTSGEEE